MTLHYGKALPRDQRNPNGVVPVYGANGVKDAADCHYSEGPTLVIGRKGSAGQITRVDGPFWPLDVTYYTSHDQSRLDFDFLHYALGNLDLPKLARGVKPGINRNDVYALSIPLPPLEKQRQIVAVLDEAIEALDRARAHIEINLKDAQELMRAIEDKLFSPAPSMPWVVDTLENCLKVKSGEFLPRKDMASGGHIPVYGGNGRTGYHDQFNLTGENVLIGRVGAKCGNVHKVSEPIWLTDNALYMSEKRRDFDDDFIALLLDRADLRKTANQAAQPVISYKTIKPVELTFPVNLEEQKRIVDMHAQYREYCDQLSERYTEDIQSLDSLRQSILQHTFAGELT